MGQPLPSSIQSTPYTGRRILVNTGALTTSNLWRIVVSFVLQILIARWLGLASLGHYTIVMAYLNVCQVLGELGLPALLTRDLAQAPLLRASYFRLALLAQLVASLLIWAGLLALTSWLPLSTELRWALWVMGASLPCYAVTSICETLFQAAERMELLLAVEMSINTLILALSLFVLWQGGGVVRLAGVLVVTQLISAGLAWWLVRHNQLLALPVAGATMAAPAAPPVNWLALSRRLLPFYGLALADVLLQRLDILLLSAVGSATVIGIYSAAYNLVRVALKLIQSFWKALYPTLSRLHSQSTAHYVRLSSMSLHYGWVLLLAVATIGFGVAGDFLHLLYSDHYKVATPVLQLLLWSALFFWVESYGITLLTVEQRPQQSLLITCVHLLVITLLLPWLTASSGAVGAAWAVTLAGLAGLLVGGWALQRLALPVLPSQKGGLLAALAIAGLASVWLPVAWPLRLAISAALYLLIAWYTGVIAVADQQTVRRALGRSA